MATAQDLLNNVLRGLRRDVLTTTSTTDSYHMLLLQFLNIAKDRIEEQWDWHALRNTVTLTLSASTVSYSLTGSGASDVAVSDRSRLLYERPSRFSADDGGGWSTETTDRVAGSVPQVFDVTDASEFRLDEISPEQMERLHLTDDNVTNTPTCFSISRASGFVTIKVWPIPSATRTLKLRFVIPQAVIPSTAMTAYTLSIVDRPVWLSALMKATEERGEEAGRPLETTAQDYKDALYFALDREKLDSDMTGYPV